MRQTRRTVGQNSEREAEGFLRTLQYTIVARNYRCALGEIDLIARDQKMLVFVEVRSVQGKTFGSPLDSIDARKQRKLAKAALHYLVRHKLDGYPARFDVIGIQWSGGNAQISHVKGAFEI